MTVSCVIGVLWGDEGKGKVIDSLAANAHFVVRYGGGHNAGHTLVHRGERLVVHLVPSAILREDVVNVLGNGVVVDPLHLVGEIEQLRARGVEVELGRNLLIAEGAHLVLPVHRTLDRLAESARGGSALGTTGRGIGPAYADRASRSGLRIGDLVRPARLRPALQRLVAEKNAWFAALGAEPVDADQLADELLAIGAQLGPGIVDAGHVLRHAVREGKNVLCEGAQGVLLDVDHGTYPFVTSSSASTGGIAVGTGLPPACLDRVVGVVKSYATRVGAGPFPTELLGADEGLASRMREAGREYGATTGRPRRIGHFDAVAARYAAEVSGCTELVMTSLDVLRGFHPLRVAVGYELADGTEVERFRPMDLDGVQPIYRELEGFDEDLTAMRTEAELPRAALDYVTTIEELVGVPVRIVSVGPARDQVIVR
jgi:adenylosuccinate synthase